MNPTVRIVVFSLLIGCIQATAQQKQATDFSGTWVWEKQASVLGDRLNGGPEMITIVQDSETIKITYQSTVANKTYSSEESYYLDGRGEVNPSGASARLEVVTKAELKKRELRISGFLREVTTKKKQAGELSTKFFRLSKDGQTLEMETLTESIGLVLDRTTFRRK